MADYLHPILLVEFFVPDLKKFQFIQTGKSALLMKAVLEAGSLRENILVNIKARMQKILKEKGLEERVVFIIEVVDDIQNDPKTGKFKLIIPYKRR